MKKIVSFINFQKIMAQPYDKLQKVFKTGKGQPDIPKLSDPELDFSVFKVNDFPVLYVKHKKPVQGVCIYVAGGGMLKYPKKAQAKEMVRYAGELGRDMVLPYYPLCPKHNLYDVYDMLYELYKKLLTEFRAENIAFLGGSSGGNHTVGLISHINAKGENLPMPGKVYVSSPGTMLCSDAEIKMAEKLDRTDLVMSRKALETIFNGMTAGREVPEYMKYLQKGDYTGLKEIYLCFGGDELFAAAAPSLKKRLEECGVKVTLEIGEGMYHCYSVMPFVSEARQGYNNMINYLKNNISEEGVKTI
ncbi:MAG: alpha/beta hydrolase [Eubacteriales bacterium]|nr:alpha/beta hydrolase [Eubacteriales bacterium]